MSACPTNLVLDAPIEKPTLMRAGVLVGNSLVVAYLLYVRFSRTGHIVEDEIHRTEAANKAKKMEEKEARKHSHASP